MTAQQNLVRAFAAALLALSVGACSTMGDSSTMARLGGSLAGAQEVPPNTKPGSGTVEATLDKATNKLKYRVVYSGLSGPATMAHFHGPAGSGQNAGVVVGFANPASPIEGEAQLTPAQAADLLAGRWYANVHSAAHPGGELRAQVLPR